MKSFSADSMAEKRQGQDFERTQRPIIVGKIVEFRKFLVQKELDRLSIMYKVFL